MKLNIKHTLVALLATSLMLTSCLEDQDEEYQIVGAVPTVKLLNSAPATIDIGGSFDLEMRYYSPNVAVTKITVTEVITAADGTEKSTAIVEEQNITGFNTSDSYETSVSYTASNDDLVKTDVITLTITLMAANGLSSSEVVKTVIPDCPNNIAGTYLATTDVETPFDGQYDNTGTPYTVTITDNGDGTYTISDVTGGLYGEFYADAYSSDGVQALPATLDRDGCEIGATDVPEDPGFEARFGPNLLTTTGGVIDGVGTITYQFTNDSGDDGGTILVKQP